MASFVSEKFLRQALDGSYNTHKLWEECFGRGDCSVQDFVVVLVALSRYMLGILGSVTLLMFVIGGFMYMFGGASSKALERGKSIMKNTLFAIIIIFFAYIGIMAVLKIIGVQEGVLPNADINQTK